MSTSQGGIAQQLESSHRYLLEPTRHQRWYERILLNAPLWHCVSFCLVLLAPFWLAYHTWLPTDDNQVTTLFILAAAFSANLCFSRALSQYPGGYLLPYQLSVTGITLGFATLAVLALRLGYARLPLFLGFTLILLQQILAVAVKARFRYMKLAVVPGTQLLECHNDDEHFRFLYLCDADDPRRFDALVVDMDTPLSDEWVRFIARHHSRRIPVFNRRSLQEAVSGSVNLDMLNSSDFTAFQPNPLYLLGKRLMDISGTLLLAPLVVPLCLLIGIAVKLESKGPALFIQERMGVGNCPFRMLKFRSMNIDNCSDQARFADEDEHRITALGRALRRSRLDELPQLWNVLIGNMSLIGPRPEQPPFAQEFEKKVPFYSYRHIVKPGISGWAQVQQGYVAGLEETRKKVEHDFYYIKHQSFGLDVLIVLKTIRTIFTGFGAR
ncbi:hypothetical protein A6D6_03242 [Alcanivorax xiamenensis]|uniref:Bacterial sugar transferase domain-containing protein n=1 Tax=Alcanivorax xiamenensis TaxID=1177156 RepID=A0ABQ6Y4V4_9GAMM|nr:MULTISPECIES: sugar transferase [Alcanivorax]KAF0804246.1 hypothetical protein A6D6_03242 [Alcanivorax xiamenensis]